ncbi:MAG: arylamine N-acetyltransferase [Pseudorhodoplanes sp.]|uniref:arylamine N-acetyltransferase family protein n=1 Tax=Pseudorhodoplanes sp. TaxID=1934341 RepID=UPI003D0DFBD8
MTNDFDLDAYLERIGYAGMRVPSLAVLQELHLRHPSSIPFENLDVILKAPVRLDTASLVDKLITRKRGGYCYEQNTLLMTALQRMGFTVRSLAGRVQWQAPGRVAARHHMALLISLPDGEFLADVGFGGLTLTAPLRFVTDIEQKTPHGTYRIIAVRDEFQVQAQVNGEWHPLFQLSLAEQAAADWDSANWFISTSPDSIFTRTLMAAIPTPDRRYALRNNRLSAHDPAGHAEQHTISSADELVSVLRDRFRLNLPKDADISAIASVAGI